jgi:hypothetical protein
VATELAADGWGFTAGVVIIYSVIVMNKRLRAQGGCIQHLGPKQQMCTLLRGAAVKVATGWGAGG